MATKAENNQALLDRVNALIASGESKDLVYLAETLKNVTDGTTIQEILTTQGDMVIMGVDGLEVITKDALLSQASGGGVDFVKPNKNEVLFTKVLPYTFEIPIGFQCVVGESTVEVTGTNYTIDINVNGVGGLDTGGRVGGTDYFVYALSSGGFIVSANATIPTGYTTDNSRKIGGFHYSLISEAFSARNNISATDANLIKGINAYSFWDLKWKPANADPSGMALCNDIWVDIYPLNSDHIINGTSKAGVSIAGGTVSNGRAIPKIPLGYGGDGSATYGTFTYHEASELAKSHKKRLPSYGEFSSFAYGVLENSSASTADNGTTKHLIDYVSKFGIEMATGCQYVWGSDIALSASPTAWEDVTEGRGQAYGNARGVLLGGNLGDTSYSGSRCAFWGYVLSDSGWAFGSRLVCDHLILD